MVKNIYPKTVSAVLILISASVLAASLQLPVLAEVSKKEPGTKASHELYQSFSAEEKRWIENHPVVVARVGNAPPLHFFEGTFKGISVDYLNTIASHAGFQVRYETGIPWPKALNYLKHHEKIDILLTAKITAERRKYMVFTENYLFMPLVIFSRIDIGFISRMEDLRHKTISIESGYALFDYLVKNYPDIDFFETNTSEVALEAVAFGKADAYIGNLTIGSYIIQKNNLNNVKVAAPTPLEDHNQAMAIRDDWPELAGIIDKTLAFMTPDEHAAIRNKWLSIRYEYGIDKVYVLKWVLSVAGLAFLIIGFVLIWNKRLKTEVVLRKKSEDSLKQNEHRYKSAQRMGKVGNWEYDLVTETFWGSDQAKKIYGFDPGSKQFTTDEVENCIPEKERVHQALIDLIEKDKPYNLEFDIHPVSGSKMRTIRSNAEIIKDDSGAPLKVLGVIHDITDQKRTGQEKAKLKLELMQAQKMESVGRLAGGVAHDYNNISSIIIGFSELALEKVAQDDPVHDDLMEIYKAANRSTDITRQLLAFARQQTIAPKVLDLNNTIERMLKMLRRLIGEDIDLAWLPGSGVWPVKLDPSQVDQILANLCVNARDAIANVGKVTIETRNNRFDEDYCANHAGFVPGDYVMLAVSDDGCGIAPEALDKIFEPFFTTKGLDQGTGLGLSTVYGIVKQNDGFINVYSEPEKGTSIKIYLSRHTGQTVEAHSEKTLDIPLGQGETVLLVEDDGSILKLGERILKNLGYVVLSANSPSEAVKLAEEHADEINLLITDVVMPEMNGRELSEQLHTLYPDLKILFMSGYTANVIAHRGVLEDGVNFMSKPFSKKDMADKIREVLDEAKS